MSGYMSRFVLAACAVFVPVYVVVQFLSDHPWALVTLAAIVLGPLALWLCALFIAAAVM
jgi:hypothetical protein